VLTLGLRLGFEALVGNTVEASLPHEGDDHPDQAGYAART
jgi:hypothetical protein